jgi:hypothetical protein
MSFDDATYQSSWATVIDEFTGMAEHNAEAYLRDPSTGPQMTKSLRGLIEDPVPRSVTAADRTEYPLGFHMRRFVEGQSTFETIGYWNDESLNRSGLRG